MKRPKAATLRTLSAVGFLILIVVGASFHLGWGTPSVFGIYDIAAICPLGALGVMLASKTVVPPVLIGFGIAVVLILLFGRFFCAWLCPFPLLRKVFGIKEKSSKKELSAKKGKETKLIIENKQQDIQKEIVSIQETGELAPVTKGAKAKKGFLKDSRNWVLGGVLVSTALFGFPVFCLICPIGLSFAVIIALLSLFQFGEVSLSLLVFPAILIFEVVVLRKWCHKLCPLGALMSLISRGNKTLRPNKKKNKCLREEDETACNKCGEICPENVDLHGNDSETNLHECTKCGDCVDGCPMKAISFSFLKERR